MSAGNQSLEILRALARRLASNPDFMAHVLAAYERQEGLDEEGVARRLGTLPEMVVRLALCKRPDVNSADFYDRINELSDFTLIDEAKLADLLQRVSDVVERGAAAPWRIGRSARVLTAFAHAAAAIRGFANESMRNPGLVLTSMLAIITISVSVVVFREYTEPPVDNSIANDRAGKSTPSQPSSVGRSDEASPETSRPSAATASEAVPTPHSRTNDQRSRELNAKATVRLGLDDSSVLRDEESSDEEKTVRLSPVPTRFIFALAEGSPKGAYSVSVVDAYGKPLVTQRGKSFDGKTLRIVLDIQGLRGKYRLCISRKGEAPDCYPALVGGDQGDPNGWSQ